MSALKHVSAHAVTHVYARVEIPLHAHNHAHVSACFHTHANMRPQPHPAGPTAQSEIAHRQARVDQLQDELAKLR